MKTQYILVLTDLMMCKKKQNYNLNKHLEKNGASDSLNRDLFAKERNGHNTSAICCWIEELNIIVLNLTIQFIDLLDFMKIEALRDPPGPPEAIEGLKDVSILFF